MIALTMVGLLGLAIGMVPDGPQAAGPGPGAGSSATANPSRTAPARPSAPAAAPALGRRPRPSATARVAPREESAKDQIRVPRSGSGRFLRAAVPAGARGQRGRLVRYDVVVERDLRLDADAQARIVHRALSDRRSWRGSGQWRFALVRSARNADVHLLIATPDTTDALCAPLRTLGKVSCQTGDRVVLNARRWVRGAESYGDDLTRYRQYLVNHEVGHFLGFGHVDCPGRGRRAPVMLQQTKGLRGCRANPWPDPGRD